MSEADDFVAAVEAIYAAGLDTTLWPQALSRMTQLVGGIGGTFEVIEKTSLRHREMQSVNLPRPDQSDYLDHYGPLSPRLALAVRLPTGAIFWDHQLGDEAALERTVFYAEFLTRMDFRYCIGPILANTPTELSVISVQRSRRQGHVDDAGISLMKRLLPHAQGALDIARRLKGSNDQLKSLEQSLDMFADGAALLHEDGRLGYCNSAFQAIVRSRDGIRLKNAMLEFDAASAQARFDSALAEALCMRRGGNRETSSDFVVPRQRADTPPYLLSLRPLPAGEYECGPQSAAVAILFVRDPLRLSATAAQISRDVFGFTEAEADLAHALQVGSSPSDYARSRGVSLNTVYFHLRQIKEKTGCNRMAALVRRLNEMQLPLREG